MIRNGSLEFLVLKRLWDSSKMEPKIIFPDISGSIKLGSEVTTQTTTLEAYANEKTVQDWHETSDMVRVVHN